VAAACFPTGELTALRLLSLLDGVWLVAVVFFGARRDLDVAAALMLSHGALFLAVVSILADAARRDRCGWDLVVGVCLGGPVVSIPGLELLRARQARLAPNRG